MTTLDFQGRPVPDTGTVEAGLKHVSRSRHSIPVQLVKQGRFDRLLLYGLMMSSDTGREAIKNNGSYRWADHIYRGEASGRFLIGKYIDRYLLRSRGGRGMRNRFRWVQSNVEQQVRQRRGGARPVRILSVPFGMGRDVMEPLRRLNIDRGLRDIELYGLDLDADAVHDARALARMWGFDEARIRCDDALKPQAYPAGPFDLIVNIGFVNYLNDTEARWTFRHLFGLLAPGGTLLTHSTVLPPKNIRFILDLSDFKGFYRGVEDLRLLLQGLPIVDFHAEVEPLGIDSLLRLTKIAQG
jgi:hypothetical protein